MGGILGVLTLRFLTGLFINMFIQFLMLALLPKVTEQLNIFAVGQQVIWNYKARASHGQIQKVPAQVVKLGTKRVQIRIQQDDGEFVDRWVNQNKLEKVNIIL